MLRRYDGVLEFIRERHAGFGEIDVDFMGGEMFFIPGVQESYKEMFRRTRELSLEIGKPIRCLIGTNLLYEDLGPLFETLEYMRSLDPSLLRHVFTSYDIDGRFRSAERVDLHRENTMKVLGYMRGIGLQFGLVSVLSKKSIEKFLDPRTELEKYIKDTYDFYYKESLKYIDGRNRGLRLSWTAMSPNSVDPAYTEENVPTAEDICGFYRHLVDNYGTLMIIDALKHDKVLRCCGNCYVCKGDGVERACGAGMYGPEMLRPENLHVPDNDPEHVFKYLIGRFKCMECKYFQKCYIRPCPCLLNLKTV